MKDRKRIAQLLKHVGRIIMITAAILVCCKVVAPTLMLPFSEEQFDLSVVAALALIVTGDVLNL